MKSSREILEKTGISRATLNNYIGMGLLPKPVVQRTSPLSLPHRTPQLGFFPDDALDRIAEIDRLKKEGYLMSEIVELMSGPGGDPSRAGEDGGSSPLPKPAASPPPPKLTIDAISDPAFMVNHNLELVWFNAAAQNLLLGAGHELPATSEERNVVHLLTGLFPVPHNSSALLRLQIGLAKSRLSKNALAGICRGLTPERLSLVEAMYDEAETHAANGIVDVPLTLLDAAGVERQHRAFATFFREGIFFIVKPVGTGEESLLDFLMRRDEVIRSLLRKRLPVLTNVAVLVADLQNSVQICSELPPEEYFELVNDMYSALAPIFRKYYGTHGKHAGDGLVYYFFPRPECHYVFSAVCCAQEMRAEIQKLSKAWQIRKNWLNELYLNIGLNEGQEWVGTYQTANSVEFVVLGDTINQAARLSDFARYGSIWATKSFMGKLAATDRNRVRFGVNRKTPDGRQVLVPSSFALVSSLVDFQGAHNEKLRDIAAFPVAEIIEVSLS